MSKTAKSLGGIHNITPQWEFTRGSDGWPSPSSSSLHLQLRTTQLQFVSGCTCECANVVPGFQQVPSIRCGTYCTYTHIRTYLGAPWFVCGWVCGSRCAIGGDEWCKRCINIIIADDGDLASRLLHKTRRENSKK